MDILFSLYISISGMMCITFKFELKKKNVKKYPALGKGCDCF